MCKFLASLLIFAAFGAPSFSFATEQSPRALVHLLDYLAQDYGGAVNSDGHVISESEYKEQLEFAKRTSETNSNLEQTKNHPEIQSKLLELQNLIQAKAKPGQVAEAAQDIKSKIIEITGLEVAPSDLPVLSTGALLFQKNCVSCHGFEGKGDGLSARGLKPPPANFWDSERMNHLSPFKAFNAIRIGVPATAMAPFPSLSDKDVWALSFYVMSLRHMWVAVEEKERREDLPRVSLKELATLTDEKLLASVNSKSSKEGNKILASLRTSSGSENYKNPLVLARSYLKESLDNYKNGNFIEAKNKALMAYLEGVEPIEPKLKAIDMEAMIKLENQMAFVRQNIDSKRSLSQIEGSVNSAYSQIDIADTLLNAAPASPGLTFTVASAIILREGFEAVLIIIALLGVLKASGSHAASRWIHGGWIAALFCGVLAWIFSGWLIGMSGAGRELMEGITSIFAVAILLYMGFWLHSKTESGRWRAFINDRVRAALEKRNLIGLGLISFTAVFREAFETVLFLRALWIEGGMSSKTAMISGVVSSLAIIFILSWGILRYSAKIPIKKLFDVSSTLMGILAVILIGKGFHSLQETGLISITAIPLNIRIDLIGIYPTLETVLSQLITLLLVVGLWFYGKRPSVSGATVATS